MSRQEGDEGSCESTVGEGVVAEEAFGSVTDTTSTGAGALPLQLADTTAPSPSAPVKTIQR